MVGSAIFRISKKLKLLKVAIREFSKCNFSNLEKRVKKAHEVLLNCQNQMLANPSLANAMVELDALTKWHTLAKVEEAFFC